MARALHHHPGARRLAARGESVQTTQIYLHADMRLKEQALAHAALSEGPLLRQLTREAREPTKGGSDTECQGTCGESGPERSPLLRADGIAEHRDAEGGLVEVLELADDRNPDGGADPLQRRVTTRLGDASVEDVLEVRDLRPPGDSSLLRLLQEVEDVVAHLLAEVARVLEVGLEVTLDGLRRPPRLRTVEGVELVEDLVPRRLRRVPGGAEVPDPLREALRAPLRLDDPGLQRLGFAFQLVGSGALAR